MTGRGATESWSPSAERRHGIQRLLPGRGVVKIPQRGLGAPYVAVGQRVLRDECEAPRYRQRSSDSV
jgi:hypothetical protein